MLAASFTALDAGLCIVGFFVVVLVITVLLDKLGDGDEKVGADRLLEAGFSGRRVTEEMVAQQSEY